MVVDSLACLATQTSQMPERVLVVVVNERADPEMVIKPNINPFL